MTLELRGLVKHYSLEDGELVRAVDGVSLSIGAGQLVAVYGPSGSGKSTLINLIAGFLRPDAGSIVFQDRDLLTLSDREQASYRLRDLGLIDQRSLLLLPGGTVVQNAAMKLWMIEGTKAAVRRIAPLLQELGLGARLDQRAEHLSMGELQRVSIARALSTNPKLILADEPTSNLDSRRGREVLEILANHCAQHGTAVLLVTHDPQAAAVADRVLTLRDGHIAEVETEALHALGALM